MTEHVLAIGNPPPFRAQVARAIGAGSADEVAWTQSVIAAEGLLAEARMAPEVLAVSPAIKDGDAIGLAEFVNRRFPSTAVVLVRDRVPAGLLALAMRAGMRDVVDLSKGGDELRDALRRAVVWSRSLRTIPPDRTSEPRKHGRIVPVFSSKGGTGKSFLSANLAAAIAARTGKETALLDLDLEMGDVFAYFGQEPRRSFDDIIRLGEEATRQTVLASGMRFGPTLWGYGAPTDPGAAANTPGEAVGKLLRCMQANFDYVVVDCPADYSDHVLAAFDLADAIVLILGLDVVGVKHLSVALRTLDALGVDRSRFRVVLNRADSKVGLLPSSVEKVLGLSVDAMIPSSRLVPACLNLGRPTYREHPKSDVAQAVGAFAARLAVDARSPASPNGGPVRRAAGPGSSFSAARLFKREVR